MFAEFVKKALLKKAVSAKIASLAFKVVKGVYTVLTWFLDPGGYLFDLIDSHDKVPNNKYIDWPVKF